MTRLPFTEHVGTGPSLLLIHGFLSSCSQWLPNLAELSAFSHPITLDLYGHNGACSPNEPESYAPEQYIEAIDGIRRTLNIDRWFICGYSLGGALALQYALKKPQWVSGVIFTNSSSALAPEHLATTWSTNGRAVLRQAEVQGIEALNRIAVHPRHAKRLPQELKTQIVEDANKHDALGIGMTMAYLTPHVSVRSTIKKLEVPSLLVYGRHEKRFQPLREYAEANIPNIKSVAVDAGHAVNMEAAGAFNRAVRDFISTSD